jgi:hypothetical protein
MSSIHLLFVQLTQLRTLHFGLEWTEKSLREQYIAERETNVRLSERLRTKERVCAELCDERDRLRKDGAEQRRTSEIAV